MPDPVRRLSVPPLAGLEGQGCIALGSGGVAVRLPHSFSLRPSAIQGSHLHAIVPPFIHQRGGAGGGHSGSYSQECCGACSSCLPSASTAGILLCGRPQGLGDPSSISRPSIFSWTCLISAWRPSSLSSCQFVRATGWPPSISRKPTCRSLSTRTLIASFDLWHRAEFTNSLLFALASPQVFSRVMAPVSAILHSWGTRMRRYLDDWLVQSSSRESLLHDLQVVLNLCRELGIVVNPEKSHLEPSQVVQYLGVVIDSRSFRASPLPDRVAKLQSTAGEFLSCADPPASTWLSLLGMLSSLSHLVPGGRLRVRSLQLCLHRSWDQSVRIPWPPDCLRDLRWWLHLPRLSLGVSLTQVSPDLDFWSDASDVCWGAHLGSLTASGLWNLDQAALSINARELLAIREGLLHFQSSLEGRNVSVFCDNSTAVLYLRKEGGTRSPFLNSLTRDSTLGRIPLDLPVTPVHPGVSHQLPHTEWSLHPEVFLF